jgi:DNA-binding CsgD family transcriptional regulator
MTSLSIYAPSTGANDRSTQEVAREPLAESVPVSVLLESVRALVENLTQVGFVLTVDGGLIHANSSAKSELGGRDLHLSNNNRLIPIRFSERFRWEQSLQNARQRGRAALVFRAEFGLRSYSFRSISFSDNTQAPIALLVVASRSCAYDNEVLTSYSSAFELTPCETDTLSLICCGMTIASIAQRLRVKDSTIRTHVKALLAKTSQSSVRAVQADLGRLSSV